MEFELSLKENQIRSAYDIAARDLLDERIPSGHWIGELSTSALSTATAISAMCLYRRNAKLSPSDDSQIQELIRGGVRWISEHQNQDGGWGDTDKSYSNIATSMLCVAAFHLSENLSGDFATKLESAQKYIDQKKGIQGLRERYGKDKTFAVPILTNCALAGIVPWKEVSALPFEAACVPQKFYRMMQLPVVSYAIPALVAIGQTKFHHDPPWNPVLKLIRKKSIQKSLNVLLRMQPSSGGFLEAVPLTSFVLMGLASSGKSEHPVCNNGLKFLIDSVLPDGSWPIDTNLATWTTTLSINALTEIDNGLDAGSQRAESQKGDSKPEGADQTQWIDEVKCLDWVLDCQYKEVHPFTGAAPGGWGWTDLSGSVPDADDTPGALLALARVRKHFRESANFSEEDDRKILDAARNGVQWLLDLQNRDKGWPTFCRGWGKLPFDRSGSDLTAHVLRAIDCWKEEFPELGTQSAIESGIKYIRKTQRSDGSWLPLWFGNQNHPQEENPVYGTSKVLICLREIGLASEPFAQKAQVWLAENQFPDGGWGAGNWMESNDSSGQELPKISSVEETALAIEGIMTATDLTNFGSTIHNGVMWLVDVVNSGKHKQNSPIGFYFAKLWYHEKLYPQIFTVSALGSVLRRISLEKK